ncbi:hypothetical protein EHM76_03895 [bacterium]|nr:MAG: hypothetical protein EHM76_03895 [bacterium]
MRHPDLDYLMVMERRQDELRDAEYSRLVKQALREVSPRFSLRLFLLALSRTLAYLGEHMLDWSERLQCRYHVLTAGVENQAGPCS